MVHDTIVGTGLRSYLNKPQIPYFRLPGFQNIKRNEIVTFNWPADTVRKFFVREKGVKKPIDKKSNYVKRCVGIPSDTLEQLMVRFTLMAKKVKCHLEQNQFLITQFTITKEFPHQNY